MILFVDDDGVTSTWKTVSFSAFPSGVNVSFGILYVPGTALSISSRFPFSSNITKYRLLMVVLVASPNVLVSTVLPGNTALQFSTIFPLDSLSFFPLNISSIAHDDNVANAIQKEHNMYI